MPTSFAHHPHFTLAYEIFGSGPDVLVSLHGFGETRQSFRCLEQELGDRYRFLSVDLPFHGESSMLDQPLLIGDFWETILEIPEVRGESLGLLGYSIGGRLALSVYEHHPMQVRQLVLLAPDGIRVNPWYRFATQTSMGHSLFRHVMEKPGPFQTLLQVSAKTKILNPSVQKFAEGYLQDPVMRRLTFDVWTQYRLVQPDLDKVRQHLQKYRTPVTLVYGKHDRIIVPEAGKKFAQSAGIHDRYFELDCGHQVLHPRQAASLASLIG